MVKILPLFQIKNFEPKEGTIMMFEFLSDRVIAKMPAITSGKTIIDLFLGEANDCDCRLLTPEEIKDCLALGFAYFSDIGLGEFNDKPCQITKLNERGCFFAQDLYREKYWPKILVVLFRFWEDFRDQPLWVQLTPLAYLFAIIALAAMLL